MAPYAAGAGIALLAVLAQWAIRPWVGDRIPFLFFLPALAFAASALGRGPSLIVLAVGAANAVLSAPPVGRFAMQRSEDIVAVVAYGALGALLVLYVGRFRYTTARAALAEQRLALAQDDTGVGVFELDFEAGTAFVSSSMCRMLGQPVMTGPIPLERWLAQLSPGHGDETRRVLQEKIGHGELRYEREQRVVLPNGEIRWFLNRVRIDVTATGGLAQARGAAVDITARKELDERLQHAQAELRRQLDDLQRLHALSRKLVAASGDLGPSLQALLELVVDIHGANYGALSLFEPNTKVREVVAAHIGFSTEQLHESSRSRPDGDMRESVVAPAAEPQSTDPQTVLTAHAALAAAAGLQGLHSTPLISPSGVAIGTISVMFPVPRVPSEREVTLSDLCAATAATVVERERAWAAAAKNERRFSVALESSSVPFNILAPVRDEEGRVIDFRWTYVNAAAGRALGHDVADLVDHCIADVLPTVWEAPSLLANYVSVVEQDRPCEFEVESVASGKGGWFYVIASPLGGSVAVWFTDITEQRRQRRMLQDADRRKDQFLATLAHELRNPLAPIRQGAMIIRSPVSTEEQKTWSLDVIERQLQRMALLLDDLLDVSRISRGTLLLRKSTVSLSSVVQTAVETARPHIQARHHELFVELPEANVMLELDALRISQVLGNLLTNAAKYTDPGGRIWLTADLNPSGLNIRVKDNGIGLTEPELGQLFEMFARMPGAEDRSQDGLGIGLALSRELVILHGGELTARSSGTGQGSEFTVQLPDSCISASKASDAGAPPPAAAILSGRRILVADDNVDAADSLAAILRFDGHEVDVAYDGEQALTAFKRLQPDTVLLDVGMPRLSGIEVARAIRQMPAGRRATLIAVTGWGQERDVAQIMAAGFDHHSTKPVAYSDVQAIIAAGRPVATNP